MLVKQQYCATTPTVPKTESFSTMTIDLEERGTENTNRQYPAMVKPTEGTCVATASPTRNTKGYYYFKGDENNKVLEIAGTPRLTGTKVLIVEGADIYLK